MHHIARHLAALLLFFALPAAAATTATAPAPSATAGTTAAGLAAQLPAFLKKLDTLRGKALSATEKAGVTDVVTQGNSTLNGVQEKFVGGVSRATGLDAGTLGAILPGATQSVGNADLIGRIEGKLGKKLGFLQGNGVKAANALRNNSLDSLKTSLAEGIGKKTGMDPQTITGLLPMLGF